MGHTRGPTRVARFHYNIGSRRLAGDHRLGKSPRVVMQCEVGTDGRITQLLSVVASRKLTAINFNTLAI